VAGHDAIGVGACGSKKVLGSIYSLVKSYWSCKITGKNIY
jgi:hypothetical protein